MASALDPFDTPCRECGTAMRIVQNHISSAWIVGLFLVDVEVKLEDFVGACLHLLH